MGKEHKIDIKSLIKVSSFAKRFKGGVSTVYIYKLKGQGKIDFVTIDEVHFIDLSKLSKDILQFIDLNRG